MFLLTETTHRMIIQHEPDVGHRFVPICAPDCPATRAAISSSLTPQFPLGPRPPAHPDVRRFLYRRHVEVMRRGTRDYSGIGVADGGWDGSRVIFQNGLCQAARCGRLGGYRRRGFLPKTTRSCLLARLQAPGIASRPERTKNTQLS